jgi:cytochrome c oxidase assembly factor CtaG/polyferredoxin
MSGWSGIATGWNLQPGSVVALAVSLVVYLRGWSRLHRAEPWRWGLGRAACFIGGLAAIAVALWSPLDSLGAWLLSAHMAQHFLLSMVAPPLILLGWPFQPLLNGLPHWVSRDLLGPILGWPAAQRVARRLVHPPVAWALAIAATFAWHVPPAYEWALAEPWAHALEHACFLWTGILFWWPVVEPWPWRGRWPRWAMAFYLLIADVANTAVAAVLAFASAPVYRVYEATAPALGVSALVDQQRAAAIMWLPGSLVFLIPAFVLIVRSLSPKRPAPPIALPVMQPRPKRMRWDAARLPLVGPMLRSARGRLVVRFAVLALAMLVVLDGLLGPREAATNLAGTWPWTHWRGIAAMSVLVVGNIACMSCPLIAPRTLLRRWIHPRWRWPSRLRSKWLVAALIVAWLVAYEAVSWWDSSAATAWLILGLLALATTVDLLFEGSSFCQWMCPIGQWNMSMSVAAPTQVRALDPEICARCTTQDCLRGGPRGVGCGTSLFLPRKGGAMDCTACLDCVTACPHDNAGVVLVVPLEEHQREEVRSGIGFWPRRADMTALLLVLAAGGVVNALLMTEPAVDAVRRLTPAWSPGWRAVIATLACMSVVAVLPALAALLGAGWRTETVRERLSRLVADLWPLGVAVWLVHFGFHLVTGWRSAWPPLQRAAADGVAIDLGAPQWAAHCCASAPAWLMPAMLLAVAIALAVTLQRMHRRTATMSGVRAVLCFALDASVALAWWALIAWIVMQPMQMRGLLA